MPDSRGIHATALEQLSLSKLINALTPKQVLGILSLAGALLAASFSFGFKWEVR